MTEPAAQPVAAPPAMIEPRRGILSIFRPDPPLPVLTTDQQAISEGFARGRIQVLVWATLGYALFYFVRKNLSIAMPVMSTQLGIKKSELGLFLTLHGVLYGISKFANGFLGDRANARTFLAVGLVLSALTNVFFGLSSTVLLFGIFWMLNGWFQGMGFPPCARLLTHWFPPKKLATMMSVWNTSHSIGAGLIVVLCGYLVTWSILGPHDSWRLCFFVPAGMAIVCAAVMLLTLPDTPASVGLPDVEGSTKAAGDLAPTDDRVDSRTLEYAGPQVEETDFTTFISRHVFGNPYIWIIAIANFFVYTVRYAIFDWGPTALHEAKHLELPTAGWIFFAFEMSGVVGMLCTGWLTDHVFGGRGVRTCIFSMLGCVGAVLLLWRSPVESVWAYTGILCLCGFFIYGPQALVGIAVANLATKRAAATAVGLTGVFGYASTVLSGWGFGLLVQNFGWDWGFLAIVAMTVIGLVIFALAWNAPRDGYAHRGVTPAEAE